MKHKFAVSALFLTLSISSAFAQTSQIPAVAPIGFMVVMILIAIGFIAAVFYRNSKFKSSVPGYRGTMMWSLIAFPLLYMCVNTIGIIAGIMLTFCSSIRIHPSFLLCSIVNGIASYVIYNLIKRKDDYLFNWGKESIGRVPRIIRTALNVSAWGNFLSIIIMCGLIFLSPRANSPIETATLIVSSILCVLQITGTVLIVWSAEKKSLKLHILLGHHSYGHGGKTLFPSEFEGTNF